MASLVVWDSAQGARQFPISLRMLRESRALRGWKAGGRKELQRHTTIRVQNLTNGCTPTNLWLPHEEACISAIRDVMPAETPSWTVGMPSALHLTPTHASSMCLLQAARANIQCLISTHMQLAQLVGLVEDT